MECIRFLLPSGWVGRFFSAIGTVINSRRQYQVYWHIPFYPVYERTCMPGFGLLGISSPWPRMFINAVDTYQLTVIVGL